MAQYLVPGRKLTGSGLGTMLHASTLQSLLCLDTFKFLSYVVIYCPIKCFQHDNYRVELYEFPWHEHGLLFPVLLR